MFFQKGQFSFSESTYIIRRIIRKILLIDFVNFHEISVNRTFSQAQFFQIFRGSRYRAVVLIWAVLIEITESN